MLAKYFDHISKIQLEKLAKNWYNEIIKPTKWNDLLECSDIPEIPEYNEWVKDAFRCGDPKTDFVKKIKFWIYYLKEFE